jgi:hypothetical protein
MRDTNRFPSADHPAILSLPFLLPFASGAREIFRHAALGPSLLLSGPLVWFCGDQHQVFLKLQVHLVVGATVPCRSGVTISLSVKINFGLDTLEFWQSGCTCTLWQSLSQACHLDRVLAHQSCHSTQVFDDCLVEVFVEQIVNLRQHPSLQEALDGWKQC